MTSTCIVSVTEIRYGACEKVASDFGLGGGFCRVLRSVLPNVKYLNNLISFETTMLVLHILKHCFVSILFIYCFVVYNNLKRPLLYTD